MADAYTSLPVRTEDDIELQIKTKSGTQLNIRYINEATDSILIYGNDGGSSNIPILVDSYGRLQVVNVASTGIQPVSKDTNPNSETNPIYVYNVNTASSNEVHDYQTTADVTGRGGSTTHTYTVPSGKTLILRSVEISSSASFKMEIKVGASGSTVTKRVGYTTMAMPVLKQDFGPGLEVAEGEVVEIICSNRDIRTADVHTFMQGSLV